MQWRQSLFITMPISSNLLIDSSVFIRWTRQRKNPAAILKPHILAGNIQTCGVVKAEVLRGAKFQAGKEETLKLFGAMEDIPITAKVWDAVAELAWLLERRGRRIQLTDVIIAVCALEADIPLVTHDSDFAVVPGLTVYSDLP